MNTDIVTHQKQCKEKIEELNIFIKDIKCRQLIRDVVCPATNANSRKAEIANTKTNRTKLKLWIYLHNLNKSKVDEYLRKWRDCKVEEMEIQLEELNNDDSMVLFANYNQCLGETEETPITGSSTKGGTEFIRKLGERDQKQYDNIKSYIDYISVLGLWR